MSSTTGTGAGTGPGTGTGAAATGLERVLVDVAVALAFCWAHLRRRFHKELNYAIMMAHRNEVRARGERDDGARGGARVRRGGRW